MKITITRSDPLGGIPDTNQHGRVLSVEHASSWIETVTVLKKHGISNLLPHQLAEFHAESPGETITFQHREFINFVNSAASVNVNYVIDALAQHTAPGGPRQTNREAHHDI